MKKDMIRFMVMNLLQINPNAFAEHIEVYEMSKSLAITRIRISKSEILKATKMFSVRFLREFYVPLCFYVPMCLI